MNLSCCQNAKTQTLQINDEVRAEWYANQGRQLKLLDNWGQKGLAIGPTPWQLDADENDADYSNKTQIVFSECKNEAKKFRINLHCHSLLHKLLV
jgi:hypothetical protein